MYNRKYISAIVCLMIREKKVSGYMCCCDITQFWRFFNGGGEWKHTLEKNGIGVKLSDFGRFLKSVETVK